MSTLGAYKTKLSYAVGTTETNLFTAAKRTDAINKAVEHILQLYPIPQYTVDTTLVFVAGVASLPTDFVRCYKLWNSSMQLEYVMIANNDFDNNVSYTFTIKYDTVSQTEKVYLYPADTITLNFRYIQIPADMTTDADTTRLPERWDDGIAELAARFLFADSHEWASAQEKERIAKEHFSLAWSIENARFQDPRLTRLESKFETMGILTQNIDNWHTN